MKLFLHINTKKIENVIPYVDNYLWNVSIQKQFRFFKKIVTLEYLIRQKYHDDTHNMIS